MDVTFLGTGTSTGVPAIGCSCETCLSTDPRDNRLRVSLLIEHQERKIVIDTSTDFRQQALRVGLKSLDAVLITHCHADHVFGLDDIRPFNHAQGPIPFFANEIAWAGLRRVFSYAFPREPRPGIPLIVPHTIGGPFSLFGLEITPIEVLHGKLTVLGFRFGNLAYVTDCNIIPELALAQLQGLEVLILDCLRYEPHPTHLHLEETLRYIALLKPQRALLTHISHKMHHARTSAQLPPGVELAYDGLRVTIEA